MGCAICYRLSALESDETIANSTVRTKLEVKMEMVKHDYTDEFDRGSNSCRAG